MPKGELICEGCGQYESECKCKEATIKEDELPTIDEFVGSDPEYTGDMTTLEYIRSIRSGSING